MKSEEECDEPKTRVHRRTRWEILGSEEKRWEGKKKKKHALQYNKKNKKKIKKQPFPFFFSWRQANTPKISKQNKGKIFFGKTHTCKRKFVALLHSVLCPCLVLQFLLSPSRFFGGLASHVASLHIPPVSFWSPGPPLSYNNSNTSLLKVSSA